MSSSADQMELARATVGRVSEQVVAEGGAHLPLRIPGLTNESEKQETKDAFKLRAWKKALKGKNHQKCSGEVRDYLDAQLPGWCDVCDRDENAVQEARAIVARANARVAARGQLLPRCITTTL